MHEVWSRVREGRHVVVVGIPPAPPETVEGEPHWVVVRVHCGGTWTTGGPLDGARRRIEALLGEKSLPRVQALERMGSSTRLLGDLSQPRNEAVLVGAANRLRERFSRRAALVLEGLAQADEVTVQALLEILGRDGWLRLPLVLGLDTRADAKARASLVDAVGSKPLEVPPPTPGGDAFDWSTLTSDQRLLMRAAVMMDRRFEAARVARLLDRSELDVLIGMQGVADMGAPLVDRGAGRFAIPELAQRELRAGVLPSLVEHWHRVLGTLLVGTKLSGEMPVVESQGDVGEDEPEGAQYSGPDYDEVLEPGGEDRLRSAAAPADDRQAASAGASADALDEPELAEQAGTTDAGQAAEPVGSTDELQAAEPVGSTDELQVVEPVGSADELQVVEPAGTTDELQVAEPAGETDKLPAVETVGKTDELPTAAADHEADGSRGAEPATEVDEPWPAEDLRGTDQTLRLEPEQVARLMGAARWPPTDDETESEEAELPVLAVEQYLSALRTVASRGDSRRALLIADQAMALLDRLPPSSGRDGLRAQVLTMAARVQWRGAGGGASLTLQGALETLELAEELVATAGSVDQRSEVAQLVAGVCYDLGDISSLQRAIEALTQAARLLMEAGESVRAAQLLNDQAAVYLRAGDPVRANHLLQQSSGIFDELHRERPDDPTVMVERAETEHLLARLPLHARLREGREQDAYSMALGHARAAAEAYERLEGRVEQGRVAETMGRLETARGRYEQAAEHLDNASRISREMGDVTGRAHSTAALADLFIAAGRPAEALGPLRDSLAFNVDKGSPLGLAVNRRTLQRLQEALSTSPRPTRRLGRSIARLARTLDDAEAMLGRVSVPGDEG